VMDGGVPHFIDCKQTGRNERTFRRNMDHRKGALR
jgi:hypothetical protein